VKAEHFSPDVVDLIAAFKRHGVRYVLVGGEAVIYYGHARLTGDVDFFYDPGADNTARLYAALVDFWDGDVPGLPDAGRLSSPDLVVQFGRPPNRIDLLASIDGVDFDTAWAGKLDEVIELGDGRVVPIFVIGRTELIANKRAAGRDKDRDDLAYLVDDE
jgi:hypothetical protein